MVVAAWEIRKEMQRIGLKRCAKNALEAAALLKEHDVDIGQLAMRVAEKAVDPEHRAKLLSGVAQVLTEAGRPDEGLRVVLAALSASQAAGRETVLEVLADGAATLAAVDEGELLLKVCREMENIDAWFSAQTSS